MEYYRLIGFLNMFEIVPDFVYPVFRRENILYIQTGENDQLKEYVALKPTIYSRIIRFSDIDTIRGIKKNTILTLLSRPLYAFQLKEKEIVCGNSGYILEFLKKYVSSDNILMEEIADFEKEIRNINSIKSKASANKKDKNLKYYGTGRKGSALAKVYLVPGNGKIIINNREMNETFMLQDIIRRPLILTKSIDKFDVLAHVKGGEYYWQARAIQCAIVRALLQIDSNYRRSLNKEDLMRREPIVSTGKARRRALQFNAKRRQIKK